MSTGSRVSGRIVLWPGQPFDGVRVFSATLAEQRAQLGETVTAWIAAHPSLTITEFTVTQSSDSEFHMVAICVFYVSTRTRVIT